MTAVGDRRTEPDLDRTLVDLDRLMRQIRARLRDVPRAAPRPAIRSSVEPHAVNLALAQRLTAR